MKKVISIALALVMMLAVCVPAFAADSTQTISKTDAEQTKTADVVTKTTDESDQNAEKYTVTIPASVTIPWGKTDAVDAPYTVETQLLLGAKIKVSVAANDSGAMTATGTDKTLTYALANGDAVEFGDLCAAGTAPATQPNVTIADFSTAPIAEYTGTMTYTVEYVAPVSPAPAP